MNATQNATTVPTVAATAHKFVPGDRIAVKLKNYRGEIPTYSHHFTMGSALDTYDGNEALVDRARSLGHDLFFAVNEGAMISAHPQEVFERTQVELGDTIEMSGEIFTVERTFNNNIKLVPLATV